MPEQVLVDGSESVDSQNQTLNFHQQRNRCKIVAYTTGEKPQNIATYQILPLGADVPALHLLAIPSEGAAADVQPANTVLAFEDTVFVDSEEAAVAGFHDS